MKLTNSFFNNYNYFCFFKKLSEPNWCKFVIEVFKKLQKLEQVQKLSLKIHSLIILVKIRV